MNVYKIYHDDFIECRHGTVEEISTGLIEQNGLDRGRYTYDEKEALDRYESLRIGETSRTYYAGIPFYFGSGKILEVAEIDDEDFSGDPVEDFYKTLCPEIIKCEVSRPWTRE